MLQKKINLIYLQTSITLNNYRIFMIDTITNLVITILFFLSSLIFFQIIIYILTFSICYLATQNQLWNTVEEAASLTQC